MQNARASRQKCPRCLPRVFTHKFLSLSQSKKASRGRIYGQSRTIKHLLTDINGKYLRDEKDRNQGRQ